MSPSSSIRSNYMDHACVLSNHGLPTGRLSSSNGFERFFKHTAVLVAASCNEVVSLQWPKSMGVNTAIGDALLVRTRATSYLSPRSDSQYCWISFNRDKVENYKIFSLLLPLYAASPSSMSGPSIKVDCVWWQQLCHKFLHQHSRNKSKTQSNTCKTHYLYAIRL